MDKTYYFNISSEQFDNLAGSILKLESPTILYIDVNYYLALKKLDEMAHLFNIARFNLWQACKPNELYHRNKYSDDFSIFWARSTSWQSSVLWFNHCEDYILQAVWLGLNLHKVPQTSKSWFSHALKKCKYDEVIDRLSKDESPRNKGILLTALTSYRAHESVKKLRKWSNTLKHHGLIEISEIENILRKRSELAEWFGEDGGKIFNLDDLLPELIDLSYGIETTITACNYLKDHASLISNTFSPSNFFQVDKTGAIIVTSPNPAFSY